MELAITYQRGLDKGLYPRILQGSKLGKRPLPGAFYVILEDAAVSFSAASALWAARKGIRPKGQMMSQEELSDVDAFQLSDKDAVEEALIRSYILEHFSR